MVGWLAQEDGPLEVVFGSFENTMLWVVLGVSFVALLFAAAHMDAHGIPLRFGLGLVLGWMVYRLGSIFPAMVAHAAFDYIQLFFLSRAIQQQGAAEALAPSVHPAPLGTAAYLQAGMGLLAIGIGLALLIRGHQRRIAAILRTP